MAFPYIPIPGTASGESMRYIIQIGIVTVFLLCALPIQDAASNTESETALAKIRSSQHASDVRRGHAVVQDGVVYWLRTAHDLKEPDSLSLQRWQASSREFVSVVEWTTGFPVVHSSEIIRLTPNVDVCAIVWDPLPEQEGNTSLVCWRVRAGLAAEISRVKLGSAWSFSTATDPTGATIVFYWKSESVSRMSLWASLLDSDFDHTRAFQILPTSPDRLDRGGIDVVATLSGPLLATDATVPNSEGTALTGQICLTHLNWNFEIEEQSCRDVGAVAVATDLHIAASDGNIVVIRRHRSEENQIFFDGGWLENLDIKIPGDRVDSLFHIHNPNDVSSCSRR